MFSTLLSRTTLVLLFASSLAAAQPLQLLDCPEVNLLGVACEDAAEQEDVCLPPRPHAPDSPLFTLQTMRPDTPPLLVKVFNDPSDANIQAYLAWEHRYLAQTFAVDAKLKQARQQQKR